MSNQNLINDTLFFSNALTYDALRHIIFKFYHIHDLFKNIYMKIKFIIPFKTMDLTYNWYLNLKILLHFFAQVNLTSTDYHHINPA